MTQEPDSLLWFRSPLLRRKSSSPVRAPSSDQEAAISPEDSFKLAGADDAVHRLPEFHRHTGATNLELFYDLYFVANLTVFTNIHDVNNIATLQQYIGFFCVLWFTWYQVSLYDVRFGVDSAFERIAKAFQFIGPHFDVGEDTRDDDFWNGSPIGYYKTFTMALMVSRLVLVLQYLQTTYFLRQYKKAILPMALSAAMYFVAAMIYLGLYWAFRHGRQNRPYIAWYVMAVTEAAVITLISLTWRTISFKGTHLTQRMSLLTLIILGEGVLGVAERCQRIAQSLKVLRFDPSTVGNIICAALILYFLYMIYFDWFEEEHSATTYRLIIWSWLHFPLHLALVLAVEGLAQCVIWCSGVVSLSSYGTTEPTDEELKGYSVKEFDLYAQRLNETASRVVYSKLVSATTLDEILSSFKEHRMTNNATRIVARGMQDYNASLAAINWLNIAPLPGILNVAGFSAGHESLTNATRNFNAASTENVTNVNETLDESGETIEKVVEVFVLTYLYFFVTIGLVLILCCVLGALVKRSSLIGRHHWVRITASSLIGLGLCLLAIMAGVDDGEALSNFIVSPWILPTVTICLFVVVLINNVRLRMPTLGKARNHDTEII